MLAPAVLRVEPAEPVAEPDWEEEDRAVDVIMPVPVVVAEEERVDVDEVLFAVAV